MGIDRPLRMISDEALLPDDLINDSRNGQRKGKRAGFPRFKSRRRARPSIRFTTAAFRCEARHAVLLRIGRVKLHEPGTRLAGRVAASTARVLAVSVRFGPQDAKCTETCTP
jgi:hypothetical protein